VGKFKPNAFGLYHMLGNASEWTFDCYNKTYEGAPENGSAWEPSEAWVSGSCALRVVRGGSWSNSEWRVRSANRVGANAAGRDNIGGFRVARNE
jgi:formylglycine-generating enzyme required for sulfatase activity